MTDNLISRQAAIDAFGLSEKTRKFGGDHSGYETMMLYEIQDIIENIPTAEPKKGKWVPLTDGWAVCSVCEHLERAAGLKWRFCPNCGARMEESDG